MKLALFATAAAAAVLVSAQDSSSVAETSSAVASSTVSASVSASASASASSSPLIPSTISSTCQSFLSDLNADATIATCITPLLSLTSSATNTSSSSNTTSLTSSLKKLCSANGCTATTLRSKLTHFYGNCSAELNGAEGTYDETVRGMYDILYVVHPLKEVVCTKDAASGEYCVTALSSNLTTTSAANTTISTNATVVANYVLPQDEQPEHIAAQYLSISYSPATNPTFAKRADATSSSTISYPNSTTYRNTNLPYLFIQPTSAANVLCSTCASAIFSAYASWEVNTPYALGLSASPILGGQSDLWSGATATCGSTWTNKIETAALGSAATDASSTSASGVLSAGSREVGGWGSMVGLMVVGAGMVLAV